MAGDPAGERRRRPYRLTKAEQEVIACWDAEGRTWLVDTTWPPMAKRLRGLAARYGLPVKEYPPYRVVVRGLPMSAVLLRGPRGPRRPGNIRGLRGQSVAAGVEGG